MSRIRRRLMAQVASEPNALPAGCVRCEYLESQWNNNNNQGQYINTENILTNTDVVILDFAVLSGNSSKSMFGWRYKGNHTDVYFCQLTSNSGESMMFPCGVPSSEAERFNAPIGKRVRLTMDPNSNTITFQGAVNKSLTKFNFANPYLEGTSVLPILLFTANYYTGVTTGCNCRIFEYILIKKDGTIKQHFLPILDPSGTPCMYDVVNKRYHYNQRGEDFKYKLL